LADTFVDFKEVKQRVTMEDALGRYNVRLHRSNQHSLRGPCPLPTHQSEKSKESFIVETAKNVWACQSSSCVAGRGGKKGGNVLDFVAFMERCSIRDAAVKLHDWFCLTTTSDVRSTATPQKLVVEKQKVVESSAVNKPLSFSLTGVDHAHEYLKQRGVKEEIAKVFGVGFFPGRGTMSGGAFIPIHNERGELVAYAGRSIDGSEPKYKLPAGFKKSAVLFNLHRLQERGEVIVVEGFFDCMKVHDAGVQSVVALMGSSMSDDQEQFLQQFDRVILFLDNDDAGREATSVIASRLMQHTFVKVVTPTVGKQPDQLSAAEINLLFQKKN